MQFSAKNIYHSRMFFIENTPFPLLLAENIRILPGEDLGYYHSAPPGCGRRPPRPTVWATHTALIFWGWANIGAVAKGRIK